MPTWKAVRMPGWKYICYFDSDGLDELYHLETDPNELQNVIKDPKHKPQLNAMRARLKAMLKNYR